MQQDMHAYYKGHFSPPTGRRGAAQKWHAHLVSIREEAVEDPSLARGDPLTMTFPL